MLSSNKLVSAVVLLLALTACSPPPPPPPPAPPPPPPVDLKAEEQKIRQLNDQWVAAIAAKNLDATVATYAPDAVFMAPNAEPASGDTLRKAWGDTLQLPELVLSFTPTSVNFDAAGTLAYDIGTYNFSFQSPGGKFEDHGKYLVVWRKLNGSWKVVADMFNTNVPMPPPPAPPAAKKAGGKKG